jgi:UDP-2,3-diacylglucosamine pyrophosphatase LpxH
MTERFFFSRLTGDEFPQDAVLDISGGGKVLIISDLHMGTGSRDDLYYNGEMLTCLLEEYYLRNGWNLVLNGDIEELQKYSLDLIQEKWAGLYRVFNLFASENRLFKLIGNHDEPLLSKRYLSYPYPLHSVIKINTGIVPAFVYHGHQLSRIYANFNKILGFGIRYILKPIGVKNITDSRNPYRRFNIEKRAYAFSLKNNCLSIIGHTHRPLFESLGRFDFIKFEIERLCQDYPASLGSDRNRIENEVNALRKELVKLKRKERRNILHQSLYGDVLPVPCLFNSGCALGKKGLNAIEMTHEDIALVYWFTEGKGKKFITRGGYEIDGIPGRPYRRSVLNQNKLDYIWAKIRLLGNQSKTPP